MIINTDKEYMFDSLDYDKTISSHGISSSNNMKEVLDYILEIKNSVGKNAEIITGRTPQNRDGSIGTITKVRISNNIIGIGKNFGHKEFTNIFNSQKMSSYGYNRYYYYSGSIIKLLDQVTVVINCDKKHKNPEVKLSKIKILKNYTGENKFVFKKPEKKEIPSITLKDKFDNDIKEGSMIFFASSTSRQQGKPMVGRITKIHSNNLFKATNIKLSDKDWVRSYTLREPSQVILLNDDLMDQISMARLSF